MGEQWTITERHRGVWHLLHTGTVVPCTHYDLRCPRGHAIRLATDFNTDALPDLIDVPCMTCERPYQLETGSA